VVGDVIGKYHPHGDTAAYDALVRMAQEFSMRYPPDRRPGQLRLGRRRHGGAMRYTECRMARLTSEMLADIDPKRSISSPTTTRKRPSLVLPTRHSAIAGQRLLRHRCGHGHQHPAHNLSEVLDACICADPTTRIWTWPRLMKLVPAPDFPTAA